MPRVLFGALAVADAILLASLIRSYGWFRFDLNESIIESSILGVGLYFLQRGNTSVTQPAGAALCLRAPADAPRIPIRQRRGYREETEFMKAADFRQAMAAKCSVSPGRHRAACFVFAPDLPPFEESGDERLMRAFCDLAWNGEACQRYAVMMAQHPETGERAARYHEFACKRGYAAACR